MARQLVPKEVEINPSVRAAPLFASQKITVKGACLVKVGHVEGKVENGHGGGPYLVGLISGVSAVCARARIAQGQRPA